MGHIERKQREKENIRKGILQSALDIAKAEGWEGVTIRKIADAVEYSTSIVYGHFENKEALLQELIDNGFYALSRQFEKASKEVVDPREQLMAISLANWDFAVNNKELYKLMFSFGQPTSKAATQGKPLIKSIITNLTGKSESEVDSLVLNWICLRQGSINHLMNIADYNAKENEAKTFYIEFMERFISSITS